MITLKATLVTADVELRAELEPLSDYKLIQAAAGTPAPCVTRRSRRGDAAHAQLARRRWLLLHQEVKDHSRQLRLLTKQVAPRLVEAVGAGCHIAAEMPTTAGDNGSRIKSEAAFAHHRLRHQTHKGRVVQARHNPLPQALPRPRDLPPPASHHRCGSHAPQSPKLVPHQATFAPRGAMRWGHGDRLGRAARTALRRPVSPSSTAHTPQA